ncbi:hypothetical protein IFM89_029398 [Coptis chinensis]|uniref:Uncharacterized protein n=1 Tax=Coptis chinensis TaxID=261450 RepID=A0A835IR94_9MAGN|nr:hypothetical protein IFM89_029398 [Coptis chinensis]
MYNSVLLIFALVQIYSVVVNASPDEQYIFAKESSRRSRTLRGKARGPTLEAPSYHQPVTYDYQQGFAYPQYGYTAYGPDYVHPQVQQGVINPYLGQQYLQIYGVPSSVNAAIYPYGQSHQPLPKELGYTAVHGYAMPGHHEQATNNVEFAGEVQFQPEVPQQEVESDELHKWTRKLRKSVGTIIVIKKSDLGSVAGIKMPKDDQWVVKLDCGLHNHPLGLRPEGHSYAGKLTAEEEAIVREMSLSGLKPKEESWVSGQYYEEQTFQLQLQRRAQLSYCLTSAKARAHPSALPRQIQSAPRALLSGYQPRHERTLCPSKANSECTPRSIVWTSAKARAHPAPLKGKI